VHTIDFIRGATKFHQPRYRRQIRMPGQHHFAFRLAAFSAVIVNLPFARSQPVKRIPARSPSSGGSSGESFRLKILHSIRGSRKFRQHRGHVPPCALHPREHPVLEIVL